MDLKTAKQTLKDHSFTPGRDSTRDHPARDEIKDACAVITAAGVRPIAYKKPADRTLVKTPRTSDAVKAAKE